jgi:hypothetical protein
MDHVEYFCMALGHDLAPVGYRASAANMCSNSTLPQPKIEADCLLARPPCHPRPPLPLLPPRFVFNINTSGRFFRKITE